jgi:hypothetical protein
MRRTGAAPVNQQQVLPLLLLLLLLLLLVLLLLHLQMRWPDTGLLYKLRPDPAAWTKP